MSKTKLFETTIQAIVTVAFQDESKAEQFFIDSDWSRSFYDFDELWEVAEFLSKNIINRLYLKYYDLDKDCIVISMEGFHDFNKIKYDQLLCNENDDHGVIEINTNQELGAIGTDIKQND